MIARTVSVALLALTLIAQAPVAQAARDDENRGLSSVTRMKSAAVSKAALAKKAEDPEIIRAALKETVVAVTKATPRNRRIWCVPFARAVTGIELKGNAVTWWKQAADRYQRGSQPKIGAIMNFRSTRKMPMGHLAVVSHVLDERRILIDQANWVRNRITEDTLVVDISAANDWSQVRVENTAGTLGAPYPVFGFIYK